MTPLYNIIVCFGHQRQVMKNRTGSMNAASFDGYTNEGAFADGPPITDLLYFTAFLDRDKPAWKFMNVFSHADGRYLRSFTRYSKPDAARVEDCRAGIFFPHLAKKYPANNAHWVKKQQRSGCLTQPAVTAEITMPSAHDRKARHAHELKPVYADNDGDPFPDVLQAFYKNLK